MRRNICIKIIKLQLDNTNVRMQVVMKSQFFSSSSFQSHCTVIMVIVL